MAESAKDLFSGHSDIYAKYRPLYPKELYDFIFKHVPVKEMALDCGTGNGQAAAVLADTFRPGDNLAVQFRRHILFRHDPGTECRVVSSGSRVLRRATAQAGPELSCGWCATPRAAVAALAIHNVLWMSVLLDVDAR